MSQNFDLKTAVGLTANGKAKKVTAIINGTTLTGKVILMKEIPYFKPLNGSVSKFREKFGNKTRSIALTEQNTTGLKPIGCKRKATEKKILRRIG